MCVGGGRTGGEVRGLFDLAIRSVCLRNSKRELWTVLYSNHLSGIVAFSEFGCIRWTNLGPLAPATHYVYEDMVSGPGQLNWM